MQIARKPFESLTVDGLAPRTVCVLTVTLEETNTARKVWKLAYSQDRNLCDENCSALSTSTDVDQVHRLAEISSALPVPRELKT